jgi:RNA polymerase sigma-70 factor (ECF subfamily)
VGGAPADRPRWKGRGQAAHPGANGQLDRGGQLSDNYAELFREHWRAAVAITASLCGDLDVAEDAVQEACALALLKWPTAGVPANPRSWLVGVARYKALDRIRRESLRTGKEAEAVRAATADSPRSDGPLLKSGGPLPAGDAAAADLQGHIRSDLHSDIRSDIRSDTRSDTRSDIQAAADELGLIFMCCHPALDPEARIALTLRSVCGLDTRSIAAAFVLPEPTVAQRIVRAKRKIRQAGIRMRVPDAGALPSRLAAVLRVVYLVYTQGHMASSGRALVRGELCDQAISLARALTGLLPGEPESAGLLALLLLTDARRDARLSDAGELLLLANQDRTRWDRAKIAEGERLLESALRGGRPGPYQLHAAIAACHSCAASADQTDWREIAALYGELIRHEPTAVVEANRAVAVAMSEGPAAGLVILDALGGNPRINGWPQFHIARAELLTRIGRRTDAAKAYQAALTLGMSAPERAHIERRLAALA